jgi:hypothetical protein
MQRQRLAHDVLQAARLQRGEALRCKAAPAHLGTRVQAAIRQHRAESRARKRDGRDAATGPATDHQRIHRPWQA